jgi:hypothetical protein
MLQQSMTPRPMIMARPSMALLSRQKASMERQSMGLVQLSLQQPSMALKSMAPRALSMTPLNPRLSQHQQYNLHMDTVA